MIDKDVVLEKINRIQNCLQRIYKTLDDDLERLEGYDVQDNNFVILFQNGVIDKDLKEKMEHMVGFRNIAVHDYESINPDILKGIVSKHLQDISPLSKLHLLVKIVFFGTFIAKFFDHMPAYALKIYH